MLFKRFLYIYIEMLFKECNKWLECGCLCVGLRILTHTLVVSEDMSVFTLVTQMTSEPNLAFATSCLCVTNVVQRAVLIAHTLLTLPTWL